MHTIELEAAIFALAETAEEVIESLDAIAAEALPELPPAPRPERELNMRPHQIPRRKNGDTRPCSSDAVYIKVSSDGVELRDEWDESVKCNKWRA